MLFQVRIHKEQINLECKLKGKSEMHNPQLNELHDPNLRLKLLKQCLRRRTPQITNYE